MRNSSVGLVAILCIFGSLYAHSSVNDELRRLHKCYGLFTNEKLQESHALWQQVAAGQTSGTDACMAILSEADFILDGKSIARQGSQYQLTGQKILRKFLDFYNSQFSVTASGIPSTGDDARTADVIDGNQPAYHYLYSLFKPNEPFSNTVTRSYALRAIRYSEKANRQRSVTDTNKNNLLYSPDNIGDKAACMAYFAANGLNYSDFMNAYMRMGSLSSVEITPGGVRCWFPGGDVPAVPYFPTLIQTGVLVGLEQDTIQNVATYASNTGRLPADMNINQHFGGGVLGEQDYIRRNFNYADTTTQNGRQTLQRRYGESVLHDFLCKQNPSVRSMDVVSEVNVNSTISFRQGISCMRCHSGMDDLTGVTRNITFGKTLPNSWGSIRWLSQSVQSTNPTNKNQKVLTLMTGNDGNWHNKANIGRLFYRSYNGDLVKQQFEGFQELGQAIAQKDDFYACFAKKHFQQFTGIEVNLDDEGDINFPELSAAERKYRDQVIQLGQELKQHQSLKQLIRSIIQSQTFIRPDRGL